MKKMIRPILKFFSMIVEYNFIWIIMGIYLYMTGQINLLYNVFFAILLVYAINTGVIKTIINRKRPYQDENETLDVDMIEPYGSSFPSNHTTIAVAVCGVLWLNDSILLFPSLIVAILMIMSKFYLKLNYVSDIIAGIIIGALIALITIFVF